MRVLFYIEPVIFRRNPLMLYPHADWCTWIMGNNQDSALEFHVATSRPLLGHVNYVAPSLAARNRYGSTPLPPQTFLADFDFDRARYCRFLYGEPSEAEIEATAVGRAMLDLRRAVAPDIVVGTAQNAVLEAVFHDRPKLFIEQAPLPRKQRSRLSMALDPCGHQRNSILNSLTAQILDFLPDEALAPEIMSMWDAQARAVAEADPAVAPLREWVKANKGGQKLAILALQPPDWLSYEGAGATQRLEDLIAKWLTHLPTGWIGVPTYHVDHKLPTAVEAALTEEFRNVRFLPEGLSSGQSELLVAMVDGLVTLSSTSAAFSALSGLPTVVTGASAFSWLSSGKVEEIDSHVPLSLHHRGSLLAFLSHRFAWPANQILAGHNVFANFLTETVATTNPAEWCLDPAGWSPESVRHALALQ